MLRRALVVGGLFAMLAIAGSVAWAATSANNKFVACATKSSGALRLVKTAKACRKTERAVGWNAVGPRGPAGARGPVGQDGADGTDGLDGLDGDDGRDGDDGFDGVDGAPGPASEPKWRIVPAAASTSIPASTTLIVPSDACPAAVPQAVNGGVNLTGLAATVRVTATAPQGAGPTATRWEVQVQNTDSIAHPVTVWVLCATGTAG
jgi:hypothetical protein